MTDAPETPKKPEPIPENKTAEKIVMEGRRMRGYLTAFKHRADALEGLEKTVRGMLLEKSEAPAHVQLGYWRSRLQEAITQVARTREALEAKSKP